jgi:putative Holliday junction resolvase
MKIMGIDYGTKRVGIAFSDIGENMAFPNSVIPNTGNLASLIIDMARKEEVETVVLGEPGEGSLKEEIKKFGLELEKAGLNVFFQKEFMTSLHTDMFTKTKPIARKTKQKVEPKKDESAAALILQRYLDKK